MDTPTPFGEEFVPALQTLLNFFKPHVKVLLFAALALNTLHVWPDSSTLLTSDTSVPILICAAAYCCGFLRWPDGNAESTTPFTIASLAQPAAAFLQISNRVGIYFRVGILISLACYVPIRSKLPLLFQPWIYILSCLLIAVLGFFAPTSKFYGPLRFGYFEYSEYFRKIFRFLIDSWAYAGIFLLFAPSLLPFFGLGLVGTTLAAWVFVYRQYRKQLRDISDGVAGNSSRAECAAIATHQYLTAAQQYEHQMLQAAVSARQDAVQSNAVRVSDFFDCAARAWAALDEVSQPANDVVKKAQAVISAAEDVDEADKPDEDEDGDKPDVDETDKQDEDEDGEGDTQLLAGYLLETAKEAQGKAQEAVAQLKIAQQAVRASKNAINYDSQARNDADSNASAAATTAESLGAKIADLRAKDFELMGRNAEVSRLAEKAVAAATDGRMAKARELRNSSDTEVNEVEGLRVSACSLVDGARNDLLSWLQSSRKGGQEVRYTDWEGTTP